MQQGRNGMGNHKHGISGHSGKSPKMRMFLKLYAEDMNIQKKKKPLPFNTVAEAFRALAHIKRASHTGEQHHKHGASQKT